MIVNIADSAFEGSRSMAHVGPEPTGRRPRAARNRNTLAKASSPSASNWRADDGRAVSPWCGGVVQLGVVVEYANQRGEPQWSPPPTASRWSELVRISFVPVGKPQRCKTWSIRRVALRRKRNAVLACSFHRGTIFGQRQRPQAIRVALALRGGFQNTLSQHRSAHADLLGWRDAGPCSIQCGPQHVNGFTVKIHGDVQSAGIKRRSIAMNV
jgi:hypothetical protein